MVRSSNRCRDKTQKPSFFRPLLELLWQANTVLLSCENTQRLPIHVLVTSGAAMPAEMADNDLIFALADYFGDPGFLCQLDCPEDVK